MFRSNDYGLGHVKRPVRIKGLEVGSNAGVADRTAIAIARRDTVQTMPTAFDRAL